MKHFALHILKPALALAGLILLSGQAWSQAGQLAQKPALAEEELINALRQGGYVLLMRHADAHRRIPESDEVNADNRERERQLTEEGREEAAAIGAALRELQVPIGEVWTSSAYRAVQTAREAGLEQFNTEVQLANEGGEPSVGLTDSEWLRQKVAETPQQGNTLIITHAPNITRGFPHVQPLPETGEMLIFDPDNPDRTGPLLVSRLTPDQWGELVGLAAE